MSNLQNPPALNSVSPLGFWDSALGALSRELSPQQFKTWIQPLTLISFEESEHSLTLGAPNRFKLDWIKKTFADRFQELASQYFGNPINVSFVLAVEGSASTPVKIAAKEVEASEFRVTVEIAPTVSVEEQSFEIEDHSKLNPNLTFKFVGGQNRSALKCSLQYIAINC
jgi:chromosomal replication initiator protein